MFIMQSYQLQILVALQNVRYVPQSRQSSNEWPRNITDGG